MAQETISRVNAVKAAAAGGDAQRAGKPLSECPRHADDPVYDEFYRHFFGKGYAAAENA